jgi:hypothetical protein
MHWRATSLILALSLILGTISSAPRISAQDPATPAAFPADPVTVLAVDGSVAGEMTISEIIDPFEDYNPNSPPQRGFRYIVIMMSISNTGARPLNFNPNHVQLLDSQGYLAGPSSVQLLPESTIVALTAQDIAPGATLTGSIIVQTLLDVGIAEVLYAPASDRAVALARFATDRPELGTAIEVVGNDASIISGIVVRDLVDPFTDFDQGSPPQRGSHYVLITVTLVNPGIRPLRLDPNAFALRDTDGFLVRPTSIRRGDAPPADLQYTDPFAPGDQATGAIGFLVLSGVTLESVVYTPARDRFIEVANLVEIEP